ncbi:hypothetical protein [Synechococcus phage MC09]
MNSKEAIAVVQGKRPTCSLDEYYDAYQWLYDNNVELELPEESMLDKLVCDGVIVTEENRVSIRGLTAMGAVQIFSEVEE